MKPGFSNEQRICHTPERRSYLVKFKVIFPFHVIMRRKNNEGFFSRFLRLENEVGYTLGRDSQ